MKIIDNFLSQEDHQYIKASLCGSMIPWARSTVLPSSMYNGDPNYNLQFVHRFVFVTRHTENENQVYYDLQKSDHFNVVEPILAKISYSEILRIKANMTINRGIREMTGYHVDVSRSLYYSKGLTAVYYVNTNNGATVFETGETVDSVENRIVIFSNQIKHSSITHTDTPYRVVINLNWLP